MKKVILVALILVWMISIYMFSNQPAEISGNMSNGITENFLEKIGKQEKPRFPQSHGKRGRSHKLKQLVVFFSHFEVALGMCAYRTNFRRLLADH